MLESNQVTNIKKQTQKELLTQMINSWIASIRVVISKSNLTIETTYFWALLEGVCGLCAFCSGS